MRIRLLFFSGFLGAMIGAAAGIVLGFGIHGLATLLDMFAEAWYWWFASTGVRLLLALFGAVLAGFLWGRSKRKTRTWRDVLVRLVLGGAGGWTLASSLYFFIPVGVFESFYALSLLGILVGACYGVVRHARRNGLESGGAALAVVAACLVFSIALFATVLAAYQLKSDVVVHEDTAIRQYQFSDAAEDFFAFGEFTWYMDTGVQIGNWVFISFFLACVASVGASGGMHLAFRIQAGTSQETASLYQAIGSTALLLANIALVVVTTIYVVDNRRQLSMLQRQQTPVIVGRIESDGSGGVSYVLENKGNQSIYVDRLNFTVTWDVKDYDYESHLSDSLADSLRRFIFEYDKTVEDVASPANVLRVNVNDLAADVSNLHSQLLAWERGTPFYATTSCTERALCLTDVAIHVSGTFSYQMLGNRREPLAFSQRFEGETAEIGGFVLVSQDLY